MRAEIVSTGTELLLGEVTDTNASHLAGRLPALGIDLLRITQVGDNLERLVEVLRGALERADLVITTGGLGPTDDDLTREAVAALTGESMRVVPGLEAELRAYFDRRGYAMPERNLKQATLIPSATALPNPMGTAPGWWVEHEGRLVVCMPGVPPEMRRMWEQEVEPRLRKRLGGTVILSRTLKTTGLTEAGVDELIAPYAASSNPTLAVYYRPDGMHVRITAKAPGADAARELIAPVEAQVRKVLGTYIWGVDDDSLESSTGEALRSRGLTLATMESCTGGLLASRITDVPGSSGYFKGGLVTYSNQMKVDAGVPAETIVRFGAVSEETARAMASVARLRLGADIGVSTTGVAGPAEVEGKPVGTIFVAVDDGQEVTSRRSGSPPNREDVKRRAVLSALLELRRRLMQAD